MASSVEGDHRGAPFHASGLYYLPGRLRVYVSCLMGQHCVAAFLTTTCLFLSSRPRRCPQAGERGDIVQNGGEAAGGEGRAPESGGRR